VVNIHVWLAGNELLSYVARFLEAMLFEQAGREGNECAAVLLSPESQRSPSLRFRSHRIVGASSQPRALHQERRSMGGSHCAE
jgi:hypothetical protein